LTPFPTWIFNGFLRFVRTAECKQPLCFNGFFRCKPRRYKTKVLRRLTEAEAAASCDDEDVSLPESLRDSWKFITVTINLCCDCSGRLPMAHAASWIRSHIFQIQIRNMIYSSLGRIPKRRNEFTKYYLKKKHDSSWIGKVVNTHVRRSNRSASWTYNWINSVSENRRGG